MAETESAIEQYRREEIAIQKENQQKRDMKFFVNRLNRKYVVAFINGMIHDRKYMGIMGNLLDEKSVEWGEKK